MFLCSFLVFVNARSEYKNPRCGGNNAEAAGFSSVVAEEGCSITIDGHWGQWKNVMRGMKSTKRRQLQYNAAEYCWRHNVINVGSVDPFNAFLQLCTDPCVDSDDSDDSTDAD